MNTKSNFYRCECNKKIFLNDEEYLLANEQEFGTHIGKPSFGQTWRTRVYTRWIYVDKKQWKKKFHEVLDRLEKILN